MKRLREGDWLAGVIRAGLLALGLIYGCATHGGAGREEHEQLVSARPRQRYRRLPIRALCPPGGRLGRRNLSGVAAPDKNPRLPGSQRDDLCRRCAEALSDGLVLDR